MDAQRPIRCAINIAAGSDSQFPAYFEWLKEATYATQPGIAESTAWSCWRTGWRLFYAYRGWRKREDGGSLVFDLGGGTLTLLL